MSSSYSILCLSHDPAIIVGEYSGPKPAADAISTGIDGHPGCDLLIGRYSYPLVEVGCPPTPKRTGRPPCWMHADTEWVDVDWLRLLAAAYRSQDEAVRSATQAGEFRCWTWERLRRLRVELGITVKEAPEVDARDYALTSPEWQPGDGHSRCPERWGTGGTRCLFRAGHPPHGHTFNAAKPDTPDA